MNNAVFGKTMENVTTETRHNRKKKWKTEIKKKEILMNKLVYLGLSILELSKILMYKI